MKRISRKFTLTTALAACVAHIALAQTSESWGGQGGASSWQAGSSKTAESAPHSVATGGQSSWTAGRAGIAARGAPGGVWSEGSTLGATTVKAPASKTASAENPFARPAGLKPVTAGSLSGRGGTAPAKGPAKGQSSGFGKGPSFASSIGTHGTTGARGSGAARGGSGVAGGARRASHARSGAATQRGRLGASGLGNSSGLGSGMGSPLQEDPALRGLTGSAPGGSLSAEPQSPIGSSTH
jgi:hypothetical protein